MSLQPAVEASVPDLPKRRLFDTTHWSVVLRAGGGAEGAAAALETLCRNYWQPVYSWIRCQGHSVHEAQELTQEFFARFLEGNSVQRAAPDRGRFRSFLLGAVKHFLADEYDRSRAQKRGGGKEIISYDALANFEREASEPCDYSSPDKLYDLRWAEATLERATSRLRAEYEAAALGQRFDVLKEYLTRRRAEVPYAESAAILGISESAVKSAIYTLRQRFGEIVRTEIAATVETPEDVEDEIRHLLAAFGSKV